MSLSTLIYRILSMKLLELIPPSVDQSKGAGIFSHFTHDSITFVLSEQLTIQVRKTWLENSHDMTATHLAKEKEKVPNKKVLIMHVFKSKLDIFYLCLHCEDCCLASFHLNTCQVCGRTTHQIRALRKQNRMRLKSSTFWMVWVIQWVLVCFWVSWPGDLDMIGLQFLRRDKIWGTAHEVVPPEGFREGYDISDARCSSDKAYQSV